MDLWVFDNDGTLYDDTKVGLAFSQIMAMYVSRITHCPIAEAQGLIAALKEKHRTMFSVLAIVREFGIDFAQAVCDTYLQIDLARCGVAPDIERKTALGRLAGEKIVFTNNPSGFARRVLAHAELSEYFADIIGMEETGFLSKPDRRAFDAVRARLRTYGRIFYCDDDPVNLDIGRQYGWRTIWFRPHAPQAFGTVLHGHIILRSFAHL